MVRELVQQRYVRQQDVSSIERLLQVENHANAKVESAHPTNESALIEELVNKMFVAWSQQWFVDRYVDHSSHVTEMKSKDGNYFVRGEFRFVRSGGIAQIPFSAAVKKQDDTFTPINLCYNDTTSGMTDCIESSTNVARVQLMRAIILAGMVAAFSDGGTSHEPSTSNGADESWRYRQAEERRAIEEKADQEKREAEHERYQQETEEWERARKEDGDRVQQSLHEGSDY